jgi:eukaryotic-like serine/threonine-protein kinase
MDRGAMKAILSPGEKIYKYQLEGRVGGGHFGEVWLARDLAVNRKLAIKILDESMAPVAVGLNEAKLGNKLDHENVVRIEYVDVVGHGGEKLVVIAMDFHEGGSCSSAVNALNFVAAPRAVSIVIDVLRGLEYLHEKGLLHNDLKPSNILLANDGRALLTDYGISCPSPGGTPVPASGAYILHRAPETQLTGAVSVATDVYQVGLTLFRLINGIAGLDDLKQRVGSVEFEKLKASGQVTKAAEFAPFVDSRLKRIILKATSANPTERFDSALSMRRALERIQHEGYWDADATGGLIGFSGTSKFTFAIEASGRNHKMTAYRENLSSARKTRVAAHCHTGLSQAMIGPMRTNFITAVVRGEI